MRRYRPIPNLELKNESKYTMVHLTIRITIFNYFRGGKKGIKLDSAHWGTGQVRVETLIPDVEGGSSDRPITA